MSNPAVVPAKGPRRPISPYILAFLLIFGFYFSHKVKAGDMTPFDALLYKDHPANIAFKKVNDNFVGASQ